MSALRTNAISIVYNKPHNSRISTKDYSFVVFVMKWKLTGDRGGNRLTGLNFFLQTRYADVKSSDPMAFVT